MCEVLDLLPCPEDSMTDQTFTSAYRPLGEVAFPALTGLRIMMLPVIIGDSDSLPPAYADWRGALDRLSFFAIQHAGEVGYLTIDEAYVAAGETHRRPGLHVDGWYRGEAGGWGGGGSWGGGDGVGGGTGMLVACSRDGARVWSGTFDGRPDPDGNCEHLQSQLGPAEWAAHPGIADDLTATQPFWVVTHVPTGRTMINTVGHLDERAALDLARELDRKVPRGLVQVDADGVMSVDARTAVRAAIQAARGTVLV